MRTFIYSSVFLFLVLLSLPTTSEAFSRRSHNSEVGPMQATTVPVNGTSTNGSPQAVPEPPVLMLMSIGLGVFGLGFALLRKT